MEVVEGVLLKVDSVEAGDVLLNDPFEHYHILDKNEVLFVTLHVVGTQLDQGGRKSAEILLVISTRGERSEKVGSCLATTEAMSVSVEIQFRL